MCQIQNDYNELQLEGKELHRAYMAKAAAVQKSTAEIAMLRELLEVKVHALPAHGVHGVLAASHFAGGAALIDPPAVMLNADRPCQLLA